MNREVNDRNPMRDPTHADQIERWVEYMKSNPDWKKVHTQFINAQFEMAYRFIEKLAQTEEGQRRLVEIYGIKNLKGYPQLLNKIQEE